MLRAHAVLLAASLSFVGCSDADPPAQQSGNDASGPAVGCSQDSRVATFASGLSASGLAKRLTVTILNGDPSPPRRGPGEAGMNVWKVELKIDGQPVDPKDVTISTKMPDHGHGSPKVPVLAANADGTFNVTNLFFFMGGVWETTFASTKANEQATITLCVE